MVIKKGDKGRDVTQLQQQLVTIGYPMTVDGWFGTETEQVLLAFQRDHMIIATGQAGPHTLTVLAGKPLGNQLTVHDIQSGAESLSVPFEVMATVAHVESVGEGLVESTHPVVLFERHVFHRQLMRSLKKEEVERLARHYPDLINLKRGGYGDGEQEWERFNLAMAIHRSAAIESTRWGMFQIMGFHWSLLDYSSSLDWFNAMCRSEMEQLTALCQFIKQKPVMHRALQQQQWAEFARRYNGPTYKENDYDVKLAKYYAHFLRVYS